MKHFWFIGKEKETRRVRIQEIEKEGVCEIKRGNRERVKGEREGKSDEERQGN